MGALLAAASVLEADEVRPCALEILPPGAVRAEGFLRTQLLRQKSGLTGAAEKLYDDIGASDWLTGGHKGGQYAWERGPYYAKGLVALAFALDDAELKARAKRWVDAALASQRSDGSFGPQTFNWWANMLPVHFLRDWAEATGDARVGPFLAKYFEFQAQAFATNDFTKDSVWAVARGGDNLEVVLWLHARTGDPALLALARRMAECTANWTDYYLDGQVKGPDGYQRHIVNFMQGLKLPALRWRLTGGARDRVASEKAFSPDGWAMRKCGRPDGMVNGSEPLSDRSTSEGTELCAIAERILSDQVCASVFGDPLYGDRLESVAYNALAANLAPDGKGLRYYTLLNQPACVNENLGFAHNETPRGPEHGPANCPGPCSGYGCCRSNFHFAWPKFVQSMWMGSGDGLCAVAYGPCRVEAKGFALREVTGYPFLEAVTVEVARAPERRAALAFRIPAWAAASASARLNGEACGDCARESGCFVLRRVWRAGDRVELVFPMETKAETGWGLAGTDAACVRRGPLLYGFVPGGRVHSLPEYAKSGFPAYELLPTQPWNWALDLDCFSAKPVFAAKFPEQPFDPETPPVRLRVKARRTLCPGWGAMRRDLPGRACEPPPSPLGAEDLAAAAETIDLIPVGSTELRIALFPWSGGK